MSIITVVHVPEGIAMAADSRLTGYRKYDTGLTDRYAISDNFQKLFLLSKTNVGISFCNDAFIGGKTVADFLRIFEIETVEETDSVSDVATKLHQYLIAKYDQFHPSFYVAGYDDDEPFVYTLGNNFITRTNTDQNNNVGYNCSFNGEYDAVDKLINGANQAQINYPLMPLKDAIDLAEFMVDVVIKYQRFEDRVATCGGPIDILVITKDKAQFVRHKIFKP